MLLLSLKHVIFPFTEILVLQNQLLREMPSSQLLANYTTDDDHLADNNPTVDPNASKPWLVEFNQYLNGADSVPEKMSLTQWWGVSQLITHRRT